MIELLIIGAIMFVLFKTNALFKPSQAVADSVISQYGSMANQESVRSGIPAAVILAEICVESAGKADAVSIAGARGLMQMKRAALADANAREGTDFTVDDLFNPVIAVRMGAAYLAIQNDRFQSITYAIRAYYQGPTAIAQNPDQAGWYLERVSLYHKLIAGVPLV